MTMSVFVCNGCGAELPVRADAAPAWMLPYLGEPGKTVSVTWAHKCGGSFYPTLATPEATE